MHISDDNLIAYLLGDAPYGLAEQIEQQLANDPDLLNRLTLLRRTLGQIDSLHGVYEPPADLLETTLARIDAQSDVEVNAHSSPRLASSATWLSPENSPGKRPSFWDSAALTVCLSVLCCLILPGMVRARYEARKAQCAENMRKTGWGLMSFALNSPQQRFPQVSIDGRNNFAGVYAVHLQSNQIPIQVSQLHCASLIGYDDAQPSLVLTSIPTFDELREIASSELAFWRRAIGGDYAYNLGVVEDNQVLAPRYEGSSNFAILADAPVFVNSQEVLVAHDGRGINMLYEDGRVAFVGASLFNASASPIDHPFRNLMGIHAVGLNPQDASLAPSQFSPLGN